MTVGKRWKRDWVSWHPDPNLANCPASVEMMTHKTKIFMAAGDPGFKQVKSLGDNRFFLFDSSGLAVGRIERQELARAIAGV